MSSWGHLQLLLGWALVLGQLLGVSEEVSPPRFSLEEDNSCCDRLNPEIQYKKRAARFRKEIEENAATQPDPVDFEWKWMAVEALNKNRYTGAVHHTHLQDNFVAIKKAYGVHVTVQLTLQKTNCTREQIEDHQGPLTNSFLEHRHCELLDGEEGKTEDCYFQIAWDARSGHHKVTDHRCKYSDDYEEY